MNEKVASSIWWHILFFLFLQTKYGFFISSSSTNVKNEAYFTHSGEEIPKKGFKYNETYLRGVRLPCQCLEEQCGCCSGNILQNFNVNIRQHFCINMTYELEDLSLGVKMSLNDIVLLTRSVSGKNPPPLCVPVPRVTNIKFCGKFTNVYFIGRNIHACITLETEWNNRTVFSYSFDCLRLGVNGVAIVSPELGGGLPHPIDQEIDNIEDYDELIENHTTKRPTKKSTKQPVSKKLFDDVNL